VRFWIFILFTVLSASVWAESEGETNRNAKHCTVGDVTAVLEALQIAFFKAADWPADIKIAGLGGSANCQYRFFLPQKPTNGEPFAFCEDEVFLGGVAWSVPYQALGIERQFAIEEDLEHVQSTVLFGPVNGLQSERSLLRTAYKDINLQGIGNIVYTQEAFVTQQEPGLYLSSWTSFFMGTPLDSVDVILEVVSHEEHLRRVENGTWRTW